MQFRQCTIAPGTIYIKSVCGAEPLDLDISGISTRGGWR